MVVVFHPPGDAVIRLVEGLESLLPNALLLEAPEEAFDHPVLLRCVRGYVLLEETILRGRLVEPFGSENQAVVGPDHQAVCSLADTFTDQGILKRAGGDTGFTRPGEPPADEIPVAAVDDAYQVAPTVAFRVYVGHVDCPTAVRLLGNALPALHPRSVAVGPLPTLPAMLLDDSVYLLPVDGLPVLPPEHRGDPSRTVLGILVDGLSDFFDEPWIGLLRRFRSGLVRVVHVRPMIPEYRADLPDARPNPVLEKLALQGQDSVCSEVPHKAFAFFSMAFST